MNQDWFGLVTPETWSRLTEGLGVEKLAQTYQTKQPFPHIVLDDFFDRDLLLKAVEHFPAPDASWWHYDNPLERKFAKNDLSQVHPGLRTLIALMQENRFVSFLERLTGIQGLIVDQTLNGGGFHQIAQGGKLDIHADYNYHPITKLDRRINVLLYLNEDWKVFWRGDLQLWDREMKNCHEYILPLFNRMVVFSTTDWAYHGHPDPLGCPEGITRKSIALYYYTNGRPAEETTAPHSTLYKKRPGDPDDKEIEELRAKRAVRRLP